MTEPGPVLSIFPGVGLLDRGFEAEGFCTVRGPDLLWGGDVRAFRPAPGWAWGVMGGPPCQDFADCRRAAPTGAGRAMLAEFARIVRAARPEWWLLENVRRVPDVRIRGWNWQRCDVNQGWYCGVSRLRHIQFGSRSGVLLDVPRGRVVRGAEPAALACDGRTLAELKRLQGLPADFELPGFTVEAAKRAVGNGVPIVMARVLARAVRSAYGLALEGGPPEAAAVPGRRRCACRCGRVVHGKATYAGATCRKRAERRRRQS